MSRLIIAVLGLVFFALIGIVTFSYLKLSHFEDQLEENAYNNEYLSLSDGNRGITNQKLAEETSIASAWLGSFGVEKQEPSYAYPALELSINFDLAAPEKTYKQFRVIVEKLDSYKFFCLNQVLISNGINYAFYKNAGDIQLMVSAKSEESLHSVLEQLKLYEIKYKVEQT